MKNITGVDYYGFLLDINESVGQDNELLSLENIQIFTRYRLELARSLGASG